MKLDVVIPAYNEEESIESIVRRCLAAREAIVAETPVDGVTVTVVSDGSRDRTEARARQFEPDVRVISHGENLGYGAAIKSGFAAGTGELVAFLDADGTCDPVSFVPLVNGLLSRHASLSVGSRMSGGSKMPPIRRVGNRIWRAIINWIAQTNMTDAASGMRVIRRDVLPLLAPLPDGLHYTPTMSCRAALDARLSIVEAPMDYEERVGRSKLNVVRDGMRFLKTILDVGLTYQPFRLMGLPGTVLLLLAGVLFLPVLIHYAMTRTIPEAAIYRILAALVAATSGIQMFLAGLAGERAVAIMHPKKWEGGLFLAWCRRVITQKKLLSAAAILFAVAFFLNARGFWTYVSTGHVAQHWSRAAVGGMLALVGFQCLAAAVVDRTLMLLAHVKLTKKPDG